jgi:hypothetical protein
MGRAYFRVLIQHRVDEPNWSLASRRSLFIDERKDARPSDDQLSYSSLVNVSYQVGAAALVPKTATVLPRFTLYMFAPLLLTSGKPLPARLYNPPLAPMLLPRSWKSTPLNM